MGWRRRCRPLLLQLGRRQLRRRARRRRSCRGVAVTGALAVPAEGALRGLGWALARAFRFGRAFGGQARRSGAGHVHGAVGPRCWRLRRRRHRLLSAGVRLWGSVEGQRRRGGDHLSRGHRPRLVFQVDVVSGVWAGVLLVSATGVVGASPRLNAPVCQRRRELGGPVVVVILMSCAHHARALATRIAAWCEACLSGRHTTLAHPGRATHKRTCCL